MGGTEAMHYEEVDCTTKNEYVRSKPNVDVKFNKGIT